MSDWMIGHATTRRKFLQTTPLLAGLALAATAAPPAFAATAPDARRAAPAVVAGQPQVPRNRTLMVISGSNVREGKFPDYELWNPYAVGANHQVGSNLIYEPLAFYSAFADKEHLWLAEAYEYNANSTELTIKTRSGISWSDGQPFSAEDVAFTFNSLRDIGSKVRWGVDVQQFLQEARATDSNTVVLKFKVPAPRFFEFVTYKYDIGVYIVPKHIFDGQDWTQFRHYDLGRGWPVTTGPWKVTFASPEQRVFERRDDWWAVRAGLVRQMPQMERIIHTPFAGEQQLAQAVITNQCDYSTSLQPATWPTVLSQNPKIISHSGRQPPYGYVDWWPISLYVNNTVAPFNDPEVRWALSYLIDRQQIIDFGWAGAGSLYPLPFPNYPPLRPYVDSVKDLLEKYPTLEFDPQKGAAILERKGWKKEGGVWTDQQGNKLRLEILGSNTFAAVGPVVQELLKRQGVDAVYSQPPDSDDRFFKGEYTGKLYGHGGSVRDIYYTLRLYQSVTQAVPGAHLVNFPKWSNKQYDEIVDRVFVTPMDDRPRLMELFRQAMEIWLPELPDIQLTEFYHRIPMNTTYWKNWPTADNPYINGAFWHLTYQLVLNNLEPAEG